MLILAYGELNTNGNELTLSNKKLKSKLDRYLEDFDTKSVEEVLGDSQFIVDALKSAVNRKKYWEKNPNLHTGSQIKHQLKKDDQFIEILKDFVIKYDGKIRKSNENQEKRERLPPLAGIKYLLSDNMLFHLQRKIQKSSNHVALKSIVSFNNP